MNKEINNLVGGVGCKTTPLISFNAIVDTDIGLYNLIKEEYLNPDIFNVSFFQQDLISVISKLYHRKEDNPLYLFARDTQRDKELLDKYYEEFRLTKEKEILDRSITTEVLNMIDQFNTTLEIQTTILYYTAEQKRILDDEPLLSKNQMVYYPKLSKKDRSNFSQYFFKTIDEYNMFISSKLENKTIYFSYCGRNLNDDNDDIKYSELIDLIIMNKNNINLFDIYRNDVIERKSL